MSLRCHSNPSCSKFRMPSHCTIIKYWIQNWFGLLDVFTEFHSSFRVTWDGLRVLILCSAMCLALMHFGSHSWLLSWHPRQFLIVCTDCYAENESQLPQITQSLLCYTEAFCNLNISAQQILTLFFLDSHFSLLDKFAESLSENHYLR